MGLGGSTTKNTVEIASKIKNDYNIEAVAHLSCIDASPKQLIKIIDALKENKIEEYERLHRAVWPGVLKKIQECNIRNYSIFRNGTEVFSYFEYIGSDYDADMHQMEMDETTQQWWTYTHPCFERYAVSSQSEFFHDMKQIFYFDEIKSEEGTAM